MNLDARAVASRSVFKRKVANELDFCASSAQSDEYRARAANGRLSCPELFATVPALSKAVRPGFDICGLLFARSASLESYRRSELPPNRPILVLWSFLASLFSIT